MEETKTLSFEFYKRRKRLSLIGLVPELIRRALDHDSRLPVIIQEAWAFGSVLRGDHFVGDLDILLIYEMTDQQGASWRYFQNLLGIPPFDQIDVIKQANQRIRNALFKYEQEGSLQEALKREDVIGLAHLFRLNLVWTACFCWTELRGQFMGMFHPEVGKVLRKTLVGTLAQKGLQVQFEQRDASSQGVPRSLNRVKNFRRIWSRGESPEIALQRIKKVKREFLKRELTEFAKQLEEDDVPDIAKASEMVREKALQKGFILRAENLIPLIDSAEEPERISALRQKCRQLRDQMDAIRKVRAFLNTMSFILNTRERASENLTQFVEAVFRFYPKDFLKDSECRQMLKAIGIAEEEYVVLGKGRYSWVIHEPLEEKRKLIEAQRLLKERAHRIELKVRDLLPLKRRWSVISQPLLDGKEISIDDRWRRTLETVGTDARLHMGIWLSTHELSSIKDELSLLNWEIGGREPWESDQIWVSKGLAFNLGDDWPDVATRIKTQLGPFSKLATLQSTASAS